MRIAAWLLVLALASGIWFAMLPMAEGQRPNWQQDRVASEGLTALSFDLGDGRQQITLLDPKSRSLAVYHLDRATGAVALKSVRQVQWDLQMDDFNTASPTPREIRALADQR
jgi:hypothetical protein